MRTRRKVIDEIIRLSDECALSRNTEANWLEVFRFLMEDASWIRYSYFLRGLSQFELREIAALMWIGRGDAEVEDWDDLVEEAGRDPYLQGYIIDKSNLGQYLKDAIDKFTAAGINVGWIPTK
jgi:hypothetical protein